MLKKESHKASVEYIFDDKWVKLKYDEEHLIYESSIRIRASMCEYELKHTIEKKYRTLYFEKRDRFLKAQLSENLEFKIKPLQRMLSDCYVLREHYLELKTREFDAFDWITQKLDTKTDDSVTIKELRIEARNKFEIMTEMNIETRFTVHMYKLSECTRWCNHWSSLSEWSISGWVKFIT